MSQHLKEEHYYSDLYDLLTIEECLRVIESWEKEALKKPGNEKIDKLSDEERVGVFLSASKYELYWTKGERYRKKATAIQEWMDRDRKRDDLYQNAQEPSNVRCPHCSSGMKAIMKDLYESGESPARVLFFFECLSCKKRKGIFDNGESYTSKPELCPQCNKAIKVSHTKKKKTVVWSRSCSSCGFSETEIDDFYKWEKERVEKSRKEKALLEKYRTEFCLSSKEREGYLEGLRNLEEAKSILAKVEQKQTDPDYKKADQLKKISVFELEKNLSEELAKEQYVKLVFDKPEIDRYVIIPFTTQDANSSRKEYQSMQKLRKIIRKNLEASNWRLMSEGIAYRLGYLSGRLKGYEREEDLVQIIKREKV